MKVSCLLNTRFYSLDFSASLPDMSQSWSLFIPLSGIPISVVLLLKFLSLNLSNGRDLSYHVGQLTLKLQVSRPELDPDVVKFTLGFKIAFNYRLNTMSYRKLQLLLTLLISLFNTFF